MEINTDILKPGNGDSDARLISFRNTSSNHGNEIDEIISNKPSVIVRWGTLFFFFILLLAGFIAWFIQYPDIVTATAFLNSINAPKEVITKADGKLVKLFVKENQQVTEKEVLGYIESNANYQEVLTLSGQLDSVTSFMQHNRANELSHLSFSSFSKLGELQSSFQVFMQSLQQFSNYLANGFYLHKKNMLNEDIGYLTKMHATLSQQKNILSQDLLLADSTFKANEVLKNQKVISSFDYRIEKSKMLAKEMTLPQITSSLISNENQQHEKLKEIAELENQIQQQKSIFSQALNTFKSNVDEWKRKYLLIAPINGRVSFAIFLQENQQLKAGQLICFINPGNTDYYLEARILQYNFGKVKAGQKVLLKFQAYPYQEFGAVEGEVNLINAIPSDSGYLAKIILPKGLVTNYKKEIQYRTGLTVQADVITSNKRLLRRLLESLIKQTSR